MRYLVAVVGFVFVWFGVALIVGAVVVGMFPPEGPTTFVGINFGNYADWRNVPGTTLGLLAGLASARASLEHGRKRDE